MILLKLAGLALLLFALVGAALETLGLWAAVPVGLGVAAALHRAWRSQHEDGPVTTIRVSLDTDDDEQKPLQDELPAAGNETGSAVALGQEFDAAG